MASPRVSWAGARERKRVRMPLPRLDRLEESPFWYSEIPAPTPRAIRADWVGRTAGKGLETRLYRNQLTEWSKALMERGWLQREHPALCQIQNDAFEQEPDPSTVAAYAAVVSGYGYPLSVYCLWFRGLAYEWRPAAKGFGQQFKDCERNGVPKAVREYLWMSGWGRPQVLDTKERADAVVEPIFRGEEPPGHEECERIALLAYSWNLHDYGTKVASTLHDLEVLADTGDEASALRLVQAEGMLVEVMRTIIAIRKHCELPSNAGEYAALMAEEIVTGNPAVATELADPLSSAPADFARQGTLEHLARLVESGQTPDDAGVTRMFSARLKGLRSRRSKALDEQVASPRLMRARLLSAEQHRAEAAGTPFALYIGSGEWRVAVETVTSWSESDPDLSTWAGDVAGLVAGLHISDPKSVIGESVEDSIELVVMMLLWAAEDQLSTTPAPPLKAIRRETSS